jgi:hypothetical protein
VGIYDRDYMRRPPDRDGDRRWRNVSLKRKVLILLLVLLATGVMAVIISPHLPFGVFENISQVKNIGGFGPSVVTRTTITLYKKNQKAKYEVYTKVDYDWSIPWLPASPDSGGDNSNATKLKFDALVVPKDGVLIVKILKNSLTHEAEQMAKSFGTDSSFYENLVPDIKRFRFEGSTLVDDDGARYERKWGLLFDISYRLNNFYGATKKFFSSLGESEGGDLRVN